VPVRQSRTSMVRSSNTAWNCEANIIIHPVFGMACQPGETGAAGISWRAGRYC
jgi:hypothetical protein